MKIILAFDSFKGSLTAEQAVEAAADGVKDAVPCAEVVKMPMADGGEGTTDVLCSYLNAEKVSCRATGPLHEPMTATYAISRDGKTAIMEMATVAGLMLVPEEKRNPLITTTYGVGEMMLDAARRGCKRILIGIGGSATCDGGMGMLAALQQQLHSIDIHGIDLSWQQDGHHSAQGDAIDLHDIDIDVICDVDNPLFGANGAAYVYAPQKGADAAMVRQLDERLRCFASFHNVDPNTPGAGAAGGLGYGLMLIGGHLRRGVDVILEHAILHEHLQGADLVITGEGKIDRQTLCGKLPFGVMQLAKQHDVPTAALAGIVEDKGLLLAAGFAEVASINPPGMPVRETMNAAIASANLRHAVKNLLIHRH